MASRRFAVAASMALAACSSSGSQSERRAELQQVGPANVRVVPAAGQLPFCLLFSVSERGVVRQLTRAPTRKAVPCPAGAPLGGVTYRIPPIEGKVRLYLLFSDQEIPADPMAQQVHEIASRGGVISAMDLRAAGQLRIETFEFTPSGTVEEIVVVGAADAGTPPDEAGAP